MTGADLPHTHGSSYAEAATKGLEALEGLIDAFEASTRPLPEPRLFGMSDEAVAAVTRA